MNFKKKSAVIVIMILIIFALVSIFLCRKHTAISTVEMVDGLKDKYSTENLLNAETLSINDSQSTDLD